MDLRCSVRIITRGFGERSRSIDSADKEMKKNAENTLKIIADNCCKLISELLAHELVIIDGAEATVNAAATPHHRVLAQVYRSML
ncbi:MAG TPA: hypothetical protein VGJ42_01690 [Nitrososphaera sp.]|jgi:hypothetical protein